MVKGLPNEVASGPGTVVGVNVALSGTLKDQNDISIHGMVDGEVISDKSVMVGQSAQVKGPVRGQTVIIAGVVRGSIEASEKLEVLETGKIYGSITARDLVVHSGAHLSGKVMMTGSEEAEAATEEAASEQVTDEPVQNEPAKPSDELLPDEE